MQKYLSLAELQNEYACGRMDRKILEGLIFQYLLDNFERYRLFSGNREKWADFLSWLYPRLSRAVDYYREQGSTFDNYINSIIKWSSKEYKAREAVHTTTEMACWKARAEEMILHSPEPEYQEDDSKASLWIARTRTKISFPMIDMSPRQILILLLKSYYFVTGDFIGKVAETINMEERDIQAMIDQLHFMRAHKEEKIHICRERIYSQYYRCLVFQKRLLTAVPGTARYEKIKRVIERADIKFSAMKKKYARMRMDATNQQIADILNIPKGTVDSTLHSIKERWQMTEKQPVMKVPLEGFGRERYDQACSATATVSMQAIPQTS
ncbi:MAG: hypothetical protein FWF22_09060 [Treponema sp.]|nr:hypothetical protein [Treponema sp.]